MKQSLLALCELFMQNRDIVKSVFSWEDHSIYPVCAEVFTDKRRTADAEQLKSCRALLKENAGLFSNFRGTAMAVSVSMLSLAPDPHQRLNRALEVHSALREYFFASPYLPLVSMIITDMLEPSEYARITQRTRRIYDLMKSEHPLLTGAEDSVFAALLAASEQGDEQIIAGTEECYQLLKDKFISGNAVQSLSHVLALGEGTARLKCDKCAELFELLKDKGQRYGTGYELATLGALALLPDSPDSIAENITEVSEWLRSQKGYGVLSVGKKERLMHAGMLVTSDLVTSAAMQSAAVSATISLIAAQQAALIAAVAASSAAAAASGSSGGS